MTRARDVANLQSGAIINEAGADLDFRIESDDNANMFFIDGGNDAVVIGHNDANDGSVSSAFSLQNIGTDYNSSSIGLARFSADVNAPTVAFHKSRDASIGGDTVVADNDELGRIRFFGNDGTDFAEGARITALVNGTPGGGDMPSELVFSTSADGAESPTARVTINSSGQVGIGTTTIARELELWNSDSTTYSSTTRADAGTNQRILNYSNTNSVYSGLTLAANNGGSTTSEFTIANVSTSDNYKGQLVFQTRTGASSYAERLRVDASGNLLVGKTSSATNTVGVEIDGANGVGVFTRDSNAPIEANLKTSDGTIINLRKDGSTVGSISSQSGPVTAYLGSSFATVGAGDTGIFFSPDNDNIIPVTATTSATRDNAIDLGSSGGRFDDVFATNGTIQTSDKNEKNTIVDSDLGLDFIKRLSPKSYKFNNKTRTHYGLIAQDVETVLSDISKSSTDFAGFIKDDISEDKDGSHYRYGLRYTELIAPMIKALQEANAKIEALEAKVAKLEG